MGVSKSIKGLDSVGKDPGADVKRREGGPWPSGHWRDGEGVSWAHDTLDERRERSGKCSVAVSVSESEGHEGVGGWRISRWRGEGLIGSVDCLSGDGSSWYGILDE